VTKGKDYKRYIQGYKAAMVALNVLDKEDDEYLIKFNEILDDFFADLLGRITTSAWASTWMTWKI